jgi:hypothetical protein
LVWWSINKVCWICQIGNNITHHYNESDAIAYGNALVELVRVESAIRVVA